MGHTIIEKIIGAHSGRDVHPGDIVDMEIDARIARDFGGANVVKNLRENSLTIADPGRTYFTFDCNPTGSDQKYAANQQLCRSYARETGINVFDIDRGIGTHVAIDNGLVLPGETLVSTDSHANIVGAIGALGQGMGDKDIAQAFSTGKVWFEVPPTVRVVLEGKPSGHAEAKDIALAMLKYLGASGLLGLAAEVYGDCVSELDLSGKITIASMATEMGAIAILFPPSEEVIEYCSMRKSRDFEPFYADEDAEYSRTIEIDVEDLEPLVSRPGRPDDVVRVSEVKGRKVDSCFIGSCTNGRFEDLYAAARILKRRRVAPGVVLKVVPATDAIWNKCLERGVIREFKEAGALIGNAGCAGCAAGQIGQNGPGEVTVSTGNRNFPGKQGKGEVYLASPATVAASAAAGVITTEDEVPDEPVLFSPPSEAVVEIARASSTEAAAEKPLVVEGRAWVIDKDDIDTDMIYHNRHLSVTDLEEMGRYAFGNLPGWEDFPERVAPGDIIVTGKNFGCGSSRQQAVDCFRALGISVIIAESFGAIYKRNAINAALPVLEARAVSLVADGDRLMVDFKTGKIENLSKGGTIEGRAFSPVQIEIYRRGGLLKRGV